jgi:predicted helicase
MPKATIYYHDIGDYLTREQKLEIIRTYGSVTRVPWQQLAPNQAGDWINQRNDAFSAFFPLGDKKGVEKLKVFEVYSSGVKTNRDAWAYNFSKEKLSENMGRMIDFYNKERERYAAEVQAAQKEDRDPKPIKEYIRYDDSMISWSRGLIWDAESNKPYKLEEESVYTGLYRPFVRQTVYFNRAFNDMVYQMPKLFPTAEHENLVIAVSGVGASKGFSALITDTIPNLHFHDTGQCFPLYYYEEKKDGNLFAKAQEKQYERRSALSDAFHKLVKERYGTKDISKEDIFYYVYGILHSTDYRTAFEADLKKMLPRIPLTDTVKDFWAFSKTGRQLADLHLNYERVPPHPAVQVAGTDWNNYRVEKMRFPQKGQQDTILYNSEITVSNIPKEAYDYVVNGKSAIEWLMERYQITTDPKSGITNDPNDWATAQQHPRYILDLLLSVIHVSTQTVEIVKGLPGVGCS